MAVAYAASTAVGVASGTANVVITKSDLGTVSAGDLLLAHCYANNSASTWSSTGFTNVSASGDQAILWRVADGTEGSTITVTRATNTSAGAIVQMVRITGADTVSPIDAVTITITSGTSISLQSVTSTGTGRYLFEFVGKAVSGATGFTPPGTATERYDVAATGATTWQVAGGDESGIGSGATGTRIWTVNNTGADRGALVLVKPGTATQSDSATLASTSTLAASPSGQQSASATLASTSSLGATSAVNRVGTISLASTSSLAAYPGVDKAVALASFWTAIANRNTARVNIGHLGASLVEGYPCTADKTIQQYLAEDFRADFPITGSPHGYGYMGLPSGSMLGINPWTITAGTGGVVGTSSATNGWGGKHQVWFTGPATTSPILVLDLSTLDNLGAWTSFDMNITRVSTYSATGGKYRIDGGSWVTFSLAAASGVSVDKIHVSSAVTSTIEVTIDSAATGSFVIVDGIVGYSGDESVGIQVHGYGHAGYKVSQWQVDANPTYGYRYDQALQDLDLLILQDLGVNDAQSISSATFRTNLTDFIDYLQQVHTCPMVMISVQDLSPQVTYVEPWANYVQVLRETASLYGMPFLDFAGTVPTYAVQPSLYYTDHIHGATDGSMYSLMADTIYDFIAPPSTSASATLVSTSTLAITPLVKVQASAALVSTSALTITGRQTAQSTAALASTSTLAIGAVRVQPATATLASTSTLGVTGQQKASVASALASTSTLAVATAATQSASAAIASTSTLSVSGLAQARGTVPLASTSVLAVTASAKVVTTAALASTSALAISAVRAPVASVTLASTSALAVSGLSAQAGTINLVSTSTIGGSGFLTIRPGVIFLQSTSTLAVTGREDRFATVPLNSTSALGISIAHPGTVPLVSISTLSTGAQVRPSAMPTFVSESTLYLQGVAEAQALATLVSMSTLASGTGKQHTGSVALVSTSALAVIGGTYTPGSTFSSIIIDGFQREISGMWVIVGGAKRPVSSLSVIVGGTKHTTVL